MARDIIFLPTLGKVIGSPQSQENRWSQRLTLCLQRRFTCTELQHKLSSHKGADEHARTSMTSPLHGQGGRAGFIQCDTAQRWYLFNGNSWGEERKSRGHHEKGLLRHLVPWTVSWVCSAPAAALTQQVCTAGQEATLFWNEPGMQQSPKKYVMKDSNHAPGTIAVFSCSPQLITHIKGRDFNSCQFLSLQLPPSSHRFTKYQLPPPHLSYSWFSMWIFAHCSDKQEKLALILFVWLSACLCD